MAGVAYLDPGNVASNMTAGAQYGYALLWIIPAAYILKYCCFEFAHRYTMVKGESIMNAYGRVGQWPFWYLGFQSLANTFGIAGRALGCGALLWAAFPFMSLEMWSMSVLLISVAILWLGKYEVFEGIVKVAIIVFALSSFDEDGMKRAVQEPARGQAKAASASASPTASSRWPASARWRPMTTARAPTWAPPWPR